MDSGNDELECGSDTWEIMWLDGIERFEPYDWGWHKEMECFDREQFRMGTVTKYYTGQLMYTYLYEDKNAEGRSE